MSEDDPAGHAGDRSEQSPEDSNVIPRSDVVRGHPECPLCGRQLALTGDQLVAFGPDDDPTPESAEAVACPACGGVSFIVE